MIKTMGDVGSDVCFAIKTAISDSLHAGLTEGFGDVLISVISASVRNSVEHCIGSKEMGDIVAQAISDGIENSNFSK